MPVKDSEPLPDRNLADKLDKKGEIEYKQLMLKFEEFAIHLPIFQTQSASGLTRPRPVIVF